jgi:WD40 repeat protein
VSTGVTKRTIRTNREVVCLKLFSYSSSLSYLAAGLGAPGPYVINIYDINTLYVLVNVLKQITSTILASGHFGQIKLWDFTSGQLIRNLTGHTSAIFWALDLMDNGQTLISGAYDYTIRKWNWKTGELLSTNITSPDAPRSLAVINLGESHIFVVRV